jgi:hypothetical protein
MARRGVGGWFQLPEYYSLSYLIVISGPAMASFLVLVFRGIFGKIVT